jgi:hypothetical protein
VVKSNSCINKFVKKFKEIFYKEKFKKTLILRKRIKKVETDLIFREGSKKINCINLLFFRRMKFK